MPEARVNHMDDPQLQKNMNKKSLHYLSKVIVNLRLEKNLALDEHRLEEY